MDHEEWLYSLSFRPPSGGKKNTPPELVVTLSIEHAKEVAQILAKPHIPGRMDAERYLGGPAAFEFEGYAQACFDFVEHRRFGFGACGLVEESEEECRLRLPLTLTSGRQVALTLRALLAALLSLELGRPRTNRQQLMLLESHCDASGGMHAHPVAGYVYPVARKWLTRVSQEGEVVGIYGNRTLPAAIRTAMMQTWRAIVPGDLKKYADECYALVSEEGRFQLSCFGNACDVSVYPDGFMDDELYICRFDCHNLDTHYQQLTLVAGLARMHELMEKELE